MYLRKLRKYLMQPIKSLDILCFSFICQMEYVGLTSIITRGKREWLDLVSFDSIAKQAGAELCQAQTQLGYDRPGFI
jgi:hypothetical protein